MKTRKFLRDRVLRLAAVLGHLKNRIAVVGGTAPALYDLKNVVDVRPTRDIDVVVAAHTKPEWYGFISDIEGRGFRAVTADSVICRYQKDDLIVDVMAFDPSVLGFGSVWHEEAYNSRVRAIGVDVDVISPVHFIATKLEAFAARGANDPLSSPDLEDILVVLRGMPDLADEIAGGQQPVHSFIRRQLGKIVAGADALGLIRAHIEPDDATQATAPMLLARLRKTCSVP